MTCNRAAGRIALCGLLLVAPLALRGQATSGEPKQQSSDRPKLDVAKPGPVVRRHPSRPAAW